MQAIVDLRGTFLPPELRQGGYLGRVGRGTLLSARAVSPSHCLILATGGAACFEWGKPEPAWEFECPATAVAFDPTRGRIVLAQEQITIFDPADPDRPQVLAGHDGETIRQLRLAGSRLFSAGEDFAIRVWDANGQMLGQLDDRAAPFAVRPDGRVAITAVDGRVVVWDIKSGMELGSAATGEVNDLCFDPTGDLVATAHADGRVCLFEGRGLDPLAVFEAHQGPALVVGFSPAGESLASGGEDNLVALWSLATSSRVATCEGHEDSVWGLDFGPHGLVSTGADGSVRSWDKTGLSQHVLLPTRPWTCVCAYAPDGTLATGGLDGSIALGERRLLGHSDAVTSLAFSPTGELLASGGEDGGLRLWSLPAATCHEFRHPAGIAALAFASDGALLAVADGDSGITVYETAGPTRRGGFQGPELGVESLQFQPASHRLLALYDEGSARFWDCDAL